jgi:hypothetical protein
MINPYIIRILSLKLFIQYKEIRKIFKLKKKKNHLLNFNNKYYFFLKK